MIERPELKQLESMGYEWDKPHEIVDIFEKKVAEFAGSKYAVAVDSCTNGIFLCLKYFRKPFTEISIPEHTYVSVPSIIHHAGCRFNLRFEKWSGIYQLVPFNLYDCAGRWTEMMYIGDDAFQVLSFQHKKIINIGRGGMILLDNEDAYEWLKKARYDGRDLDLTQEEDDIERMGWHMYMTPEDAARGIIIMDHTPAHVNDSHSYKNYKNLKEYKFIQEYYR